MDSIAILAAPNIYARLNAILEARDLSFRVKCVLSRLHLNADKADGLVWHSPRKLAEALQHEAVDARARSGHLQGDRAYKTIEADLAFLEDLALVQKRLVLLNGREVDGWLVVRNVDVDALASNTPIPADSRSRLPCRVCRRLGFKGECAACGDSGCVPEDPDFVRRLARRRAIEQDVTPQRTTPSHVPARPPASRQDVTPERTTPSRMPARPPAELHDTEPESARCHAVSGSGPSHDPSEGYAGARGANLTAKLNEGGGVPAANRAETPGTSTHPLPASQVLSGETPRPAGVGSDPERQLIESMFSALGGPRPIVNLYRPGARLLLQSGDTAETIVSTVVAAVKADPSKMPMATKVFTYPSNYAELWGVAKKGKAPPAPQVPEADRQRELERLERERLEVERGRAAHARALEVAQAFGLQRAEIMQRAARMSKAKDVTISEAVELVREQLELDQGAAAIAGKVVGS